MVNLYQRCLLRSRMHRSQEINICGELSSKLDWKSETHQTESRDQDSQSCGIDKSRTGIGERVRLEKKMDQILLESSENWYAIHP